MKRAPTRVLVVSLAACLGILALATLAPVRAASSTLLVLNKGNLTMVTVDPTTLKVTGSYPSGPDPHEVIASSDGKTAYITNYTQGGTISVVDLAAKKALPPIEIVPLMRPHGLDFVGGKLYFTAEGSKVVARYDPATRKVDWVMGTGQDRTHMVMVSKDLKRMITTNVASASVSFIEQVELPNLGRGGGTSTDWRVTTLPAGKGVEGNDLSPNGKELWALNAQDRSVTIIDAVSKKVLETVSIPTNAGNRLKFTLDGKYVLISDLRGPELLILDAVTRKEMKRINMGDGASMMAGTLVDPNGSRAYVSVGSLNYVGVIDLKTLSLAGRIQSGPGPDGLAWAAQN
jgi:DNA-binding beta-propeller fold protein YncE